MENAKKIMDHFTLQCRWINRVNYLQIVKRISPIYIFISLIPSDIPSGRSFPVHEPSRSRLRRKWKPRIINKGSWVRSWVRPSMGRSSSIGDWKCLVCLHDVHFWWGRIRHSSQSWFLLKTHSLKYPFVHLSSIVRVYSNTFA